MDSQDSVIHHRAYPIWQEEGCPEGKALEHWLGAKAELTDKYGSGFVAMADCKQGLTSPSKISSPPVRAASRRTPKRETATTSRAAAM